MSADLGFEDGASAVEYSLIVVAIASVIVVVVAALGGYVTGMFQDTCTEISGAGMTSATGEACP